MPPARRILSFAAVGIAVAAVYVLLYLGFLRAGISQALANAAAFSLAIAVQYAGQARITFQRNLSDPAQVVRFGIMVAAGYATSAILTGWVAPLFHLPPWVAALSVTVILPVQNFVLMSLWVFSEPAA